MELGRIVLLKIIKDPLEAFSKRTEISNKNIKDFVIFVNGGSAWTLLAIIGKQVWIL